MTQSKRITDRHDDAVSLRHKSTIASTNQIATVAASKMQASDCAIAQCKSARPGRWSSANASTRATSQAAEPMIVAVANDAMERRSSYSGKSDISDELVMTVPRRRNLR